MEDITVYFNYSYLEYVAYLKKKYGEATHSYFVNNTYKSKNKKTSRVSEGLFCHHIDENRFLNLSDKEFASIAPWECQLPEHLVYCNIIEHLLLHIKIYLESNGRMSFSGAENVLRDAVQTISIPAKDRKTNGKYAWRIACAEAVDRDIENLGEVIWYGYINGVYKNIHDVCVFTHNNSVKMNDSLYWYLAGKKNKSEFKDIPDVVQNNMLSYKAKTMRGENDPSKYTKLKKVKRY